MAHVAMAHIVMANTVMVCIVMAHIVMAITVVVYVAMAYTVVAYKDMVYIAMVAAVAEKRIRQPVRPIFSVTSVAHCTADTVGTVSRHCAPAPGNNAAGPRPAPLLVVAVTARHADSRHLCGKSIVATRTMAERK